MQFEMKLTVDTREAAAALGYADAQPDDNTLLLLQNIVAMVEEASTPRWIYRLFSLEQGSLQVEGSVLQGGDIARHLYGCHACFLVGITLGEGIDSLLRRLQAVDVARAVLADTAASVLVEQYADAAQRVLVQAARPEFITPRFSPGYGDFPLETQREVLHLLDAPRAIGLTTNENSLLLPRKSTTAVVGIGKQPVAGHLAGCASCRLRDKCNQKNRGGCGGILHTGELDDEPV